MALLSTLYSSIPSQFPNLILVSVLLTLSRSRTLFWGFRCGLEHVNAGWFASAYRNAVKLQRTLD